jgi:hypothetical protein
MRLATMKRDVGDLDDAVWHAEQAIDAAPDNGARIAGLLTRAWFVEERDGLSPGLTAYGEAEREILAAGLEGAGFLQQCRENMARIEKTAAERAEQR